MLKKLHHWRRMASLRKLTCSWFPRDDISLPQLRRQNLKTQQNIKTCKEKNYVRDILPVFSGLNMILKKEDNEETRAVDGWKLDWPDDNDNIALSVQTVNKDVGGDHHHQLLCAAIAMKC